METMNPPLKSPSNFPIDVKDYSHLKDDGGGLSEWGRFINAKLGLNRIHICTIGTIWYFFFLGAIIGTWAAIIPSLKLFHHLSDAALGGVLIASIAGALTGVPVSAWIMSKWGTKAATISGALLSVALGPIVGIPGHVGLFVFGVVLLGFAAAISDVSMNSMAVLVEKAGNTKKLGMFHACYAIGGMAGSLYGGSMIACGVSVLNLLIVQSLACLLPSLLASKMIFSKRKEEDINQTFEQANADVQTNQSDYLIPQEGCTSNDGHVTQRDPQDLSINDMNIEEPSNNTSTSTSKESKFCSFNLFILCLLGCLAYMSEGSIGDWSSVFLQLSLGANPLVGSLGYFFFQLFVAITRYMSDSVVEKFGHKPILLLSGIISCLGISLVVISPSLQPHAVVIAIIGFTISGIGLSAVAPITISLSGTIIPNLAAGDAIAWVSSMSYIGLLVGPPIIGGLAEATGSLKWALLVDAFLMLGMSVVSIFVPQSSEPPRKFSSLRTDAPPSSSSSSSFISQITQSNGLSSNESDSLESPLIDSAEN